MWENGKYMSFKLIGLRELNFSGNKVRSTMTLDSKYPLGRD